MHEKIVSAASHTALIAGVIPSSLRIQKASTVTTPGAPRPHRFGGIALKTTRRYRLCSVPEGVFRPRVALQ